ncbi:MAG: glycosyltransferase family 9 protein [Planctomycetes bacterium]|nr:glycosyltransferase family 9 protein [Planctomycetota bacterium]
MRTINPAAQQFERILLIKPSAFGDVLHTVPVLVKLRARFPAARIDWLITPENAELVRYHPALSNVVLFARRDYARFGRNWPATAGLLRLLKTLWQTHYDLVIDLHGQLRSILFTLATRARVRIGFDRPRQFLGDLPHPAGKEACRHGWNGAREGSWMAYSHRMPLLDLHVHAVDRYLWLSPLLGLDAGPPDFRIYWPPAAEAQAQSLLDQHGLADKPFALLVPGTIWQTKHWQIEGFAEVGRFLIQSGLAVVLGGSSKDRLRCRAVAAACPGACDLSGRTTLADFAALMDRARINVTNDSGSMHLAVALNKPVVSVFGPTDPVRIGPYGRPQAVLQADLPCTPCYLRKIRHCPHDHACMKQVTGAMVVERVRTTLAEVGWESRRCG